MKSILFAMIALASLAAAFRGSVEFCKGTDANAADCGTYLIYDENCWDLPEGPNLRGNAHFASPSDILRCDVFSETGCNGLLGQVTIGSDHHFDGAISSIKCTGHGMKRAEDYGSASPGHFKFPSKPRNNGD